MIHVPLHQFMKDNREELIRRCRGILEKRSPPSVSTTENDSGVPGVLDQLVLELRKRSRRTRARATAATQHSRHILMRGFTLPPVVYDYGDICQSVSDLAVETDAPIATKEFRTLDRCLDEAIAGAVSEDTRGRQPFTGDRSAKVLRLTDTALAALAALQAGVAGVSGSTAELILASLMEIRALADEGLDQRLA